MARLLLRSAFTLLKGLVHPKNWFNLFSEAL